MFSISLPLGESTGLSLATMAAAQMPSPPSSARASHPTNVLSEEMWVGVEPGVGWSATIDFPVPCLPDFALKLQTTKSPSVSSPEVIGAIVRPYGFPEPFAGSTTEPMTTCFVNCLSNDVSGETPLVATPVFESIDCEAGGVSPLPLPPLQPAAIRIAASAGAALRRDPKCETDTEFPPRARGSGSRQSKR